MIERKREKDRMGLGGTRKMERTREGKNKEDGKSKEEVDNKDADEFELDFELAEEKQKGNSV